MRKALPIVAAAVVSACGGGSSSGPTTPNPGEPNDTIETATPLTMGTPVVATSSAGTDYDFYALTVPSGGATVRFQTFDQGGASCDLAGGTVDTFVEVFDASGTLLTWSDDSWPGPNGTGTRCEDFTWSLPAGASYVAVSGYPPYPFVYTLVVTIPAAP